MPSNRFSVDTNFLIDLARFSDIAHDALDTIRARVVGAEIIVPPSTVNELTQLVEISPDAELRNHAIHALRHMITAWRFSPVGITDFRNTIALSIASKLLEQGIIPPDERNDALIIAESAVLSSPILISADSHLRDADRARLALVLQSCGVNNVLVLSPRDIVRRFALRR